MERFFSTKVRAGQHGRGVYHYINLPKKLSDEFYVVYQAPYRQRGFRSLKVKARVGSSCWRTSIFFIDGIYLLLLSKKLRQAEKITSGQTIKVGIEILNP